MKSSGGWCSERLLGILGNKVFQTVGRQQSVLGSIYSGRKSLRWTDMVISEQKSWGSLGCLNHSESFLLVGLLLKDKI